jgi:hypothetical protein
MGGREEAGGAAASSRTQGLTIRWTGAPYANIKWFSLADLIDSQRPDSLVVRRLRSERVGIIRIMMRTLLALLIVFSVCTLGLAHTKSTPCEQPIHYDGEGLRPQLGHKPVSVRSVAGKLIDTNRVPMPGICIGLFTDEDHKLVASSVSGEDGRFDFSDIPRGKYRLLARVHG